MFNVIRNITGKSVEGNSLYEGNGHLIKLLEEYDSGNGKGFYDCFVRFGETNLLKSRYDDYDMYRHGFKK